MDRNIELSSSSTLPVKNGESKANRISRKEQMNLKKIILDTDNYIVTQLATYDIFQGGEIGFFKKSDL